MGRYTTLNLVQLIKSFKSPAGFLGEDPAETGNNNNVIFLL